MIWLLTVLSPIPGVGPLLAFLVRNPWLRKLLEVVLLALLVLALVFAIYQRGRHDMHAEDVAAAEKAIAAAKTLGTAARATAAVERATDNAAVAAQKRKTDNAIDSTPDRVPAGPGLARSCERLRNTPQARLPEFSRRCGPDPTRKAEAHD